MSEQMTDAEALRQLDEANKYRDIIIDVLPRITQDAADDMSLRIRDCVVAQLAERDSDIADLQDNLQITRGALGESRRQIADRYAEIARLLAQIAELQQQVDVWQATGNAIMQCAVGREAPLSDSDVCCEINALRQQVTELQAWKDAVPVDAIAFLVGATEAILGESWQSKTATEWANSMPK